MAQQLGVSRTIVLLAYDQLIVVNSSQQALDLIARILLQPGDRVVVEDPSYQGTTEVVRAAAARLLPIPVDGQGLDPARLPSSARIVFVSPSHQFPTGSILPLARRLALLDWAKRKDAVVVEDDYDGEFRYEVVPENPTGLPKASRSKSMCSLVPVKQSWRVCTTAVYAFASRPLRWTAPPTPRWWLSSPKSWLSPNHECR